MASGIGVVPKQMKGKPGVTGELAFLRRLLPSQRASVALSRTLDSIGTTVYTSIRNLPLVSPNLGNLTTLFRVYVSTGVSFP